MPSFRERIRTELVARLTGLVHMQAGEAPREWRRAVATVARPAAMVWLASDRAEDRTSDGPIHEVEVYVEILAVPEGGADVITVAEEMSADVEARLATSFEFVSPEWVSTTFQHDHDGEQPIVTASLQYTMRFTATEGTSPSNPAGG